MSADFLDSNVFVYLFDEIAHAKRQTAERLIHDALGTGTASISFQVVQETLNVLTRKLEPPISLDDARRFFESVLVPQVMIYGFLGLRAGADGIVIDPKLPSDWEELTVTRIQWHGKIFDLHFKSGDRTVDVRGTNVPVKIR